MSIFIYNSLTRKKEEFFPLKPPQVNIYTCGVTVYDESHIGHARSLYIFDVIRRYLRSRDFKVRFVRNITDIDDKIINRANELKTDWKELIKKYIERYYEDLNSLGIEKGDAEPRATENIEDMVKYIQALLDKGYAYEAGGDVYFNVRKFSDYGKLSGQGIDQMETGVRIEPTEFKKDPLDFTLWKRSKENEPSWDSPWGKGRPGWHIECSVMSQKYLGTDTLDIHAGGRDLIFPHHENEIAQSQALTGEPFAKYWIHHGLLTINGQKMSKSSGNFVTIRDFIAKYHDADLLKLFFLFAHYSHPIDYTEEKIAEAKQALERISILKAKIDKVTRSQGHKVTSKKPQELEEIKDRFIRVMDDDFNTPQALAAIFELVSLTNKNIDDLNFINSADKILKELLDILGIALYKKTGPAGRMASLFHSLGRIFGDEADSASIEEITEAEVNRMISEREKARKSKDYAKSDQIRMALEGKGIILEDTKDGTTWRRKL
jgi:cysteinyl-tRNA synthetase